MKTIQVHKHPAGHAFADWKVVQRRYQIAGEYRYKDCYFGELSDGDEYTIPEKVQEDRFSPIKYMRDNNLRMRIIRDSNNRRESLTIVRDGLQDTLVNYPWTETLSKTIREAVGFIRDMEEQNAS
jgi:hypothetical protein